MTNSISRGFIKSSQEDIDTQQSNLDKRTEEVRKSLLDFNKRFTKSITAAKKVIESLDNSKARRDLESAVKKAESFASVQKRLQKQGSEISSKEAKGLVQAAENLNKIITTNDKVINKIKEQGDKVEQLNIETPLKKATQKIGENAKDFFISNAEILSRSGVVEDAGQTAIRATSPELAFITESLGLNLSDTLSSIGGFFNFNNSEDDSSDIDSLLDGVQSRIKDSNESLEKTTEREEKKTRTETVKAQKESTAKIVEAIETQVQAQKEIKEDEVEAGFREYEDSLKIRTDQHVEVLEALDDIEDKQDSPGLFTKILGGMFSKFLGVSSSLVKGVGGVIASVKSLKSFGGSSKSKSPVIAGTPSKPGGVLGKIGGGIKSAGKVLGKGLGAGILLSIAAIGLEDIDFEPIKKSIMGTLESLKISLINSYESAKSTIKEWFEKGKEAISQGLEEANIIGEDIERNFTNKVKSGFEFLRTKVTESLEALDFFEENPITLEDTFRPLSNFFSDLGNNISSIISEFITNIETSVGDVLARSSFTDKIRSKLNIRTTEEVQAEQSNNADLQRRAKALGISATELLKFRSGELSVEEIRAISSTNISQIEVDPKIQTSNQLESNIAQIETAKAINISADRNERNQQAQNKETQKMLAKSEEKQLKAASSFRGKRSLDNSPVVSDDIGLVMILGGGI